jgi:hypothetical protein
MASKALACGVKVSLAALLFVSSLLFISPVHATGQVNNSQKSQATACPAADLNYDLSTDVHATEEFQAGIAERFSQEKFAELDCMADSLRSNKTRFSGGAWKLHTFYLGVESPEGHATDEDWQDYFRRLERWAAASPASITARVAFAKSYVNYAWFARGDGDSNTVSGSGWRLFSQRMDKAKQILDEASKLEAKCPEWYVDMMQVAIGQQWDGSRENALLEQAIAFEPAYYTAYRQHAVFISPMWYGQEGEIRGICQDHRRSRERQAGRCALFRDRFPTDL